MSEHRPGAVGIEFVVGDLLALVDELDLARPHVMGFSFGAEVALDVELTHPGTCRSLVLLSPGLGIRSRASPPVSASSPPGPTRSGDYTSETHGEDHWLEVMLELCQRAAVRPKADLARVAAIRCPVLLMAGSQDDPRRIRQAQVMEEHHHRSQLAVVDGAAHAVHKSHPGRGGSDHSRFSGPAILPALRLHRPERRRHAQRTESEEAAS